MGFFKNGKEDELVEVVDVSKDRRGGTVYTWITVQDQGIDVQFLLKAGAGCPTVGSFIRISEYKTEYYDEAEQEKYYWTAVHATGGKTLGISFGLNNLEYIHNGLYYDKDTKIIYWWNGWTGSDTRRYDIPAPYFAPNGLPYRYNPDTNEFIEIGAINRELTQTATDAVKALMNS